MVPDIDALSDEPQEFTPGILTVETSPFAIIKRQARSCLLSSGALPTGGILLSGGAISGPTSGTLVRAFQSSVVAKPQWEVREPEIIVIEDFEDGAVPPLTSAGATMTSAGTSLEDGSGNGPRQHYGVQDMENTADLREGPCRAGCLPDGAAPEVEDLSAQLVAGPQDTGEMERLLKAALQRVLSGMEEGDARCIDGRIQGPQLSDPVVVHSSGDLTIPEGFMVSGPFGVSVSGVGGLEPSVTLGRGVLERLQRGDDDISSGTSGIGTPSSGESEPELETLSAGPAPFYQLPSTLGAGVANPNRPPANLRRASAPAISIAPNFRAGGGMVFPRASVGEGPELEERIASGAAASSSAEPGGVVCAPWRPRRPPRPLSATVTRSQSLRVLSDTSSDSGRNSPNPETFGGFDELREASLSPDIPPSSPTPPSYVPAIRSGAFASIGSRPQMEDAHLTLDDISELLGSRHLAPPGPAAFFGVFDGHGGRDAADYAKKHLLEDLLGDGGFPGDVHGALVRSFLQTDKGFHRACLDEKVEHSGTTALTALVFGRTLVVANAGDCRAVLCQKGRTVEMSRDQKPACEVERKRIVAKGGFVEDGYLNGQLGVARAIGNWHMEDFKVKGQLTAEPEVKVWELGHEDEFLILGCDGLWDVISSRMAVDLARKRLQQHNDPVRCSQELVEEALRRQTSDNVTVVTVCFQRDPPPRLTTAAPVGVRRSISVDSLRALQEKIDRC